LLLWWIVSLYPLLAARNIEEGDAALSTAQGNLTNQILVISFAILGGLYLPRAIRELRGRTGILFHLLVAYLLWAAASILWSDDVGLSIRRLGQLILLVIGTVGLGAGFYARTSDRTLTLARHVMYGSWIAVILLITSRLANLSELFNPDWNLKDNTAAQFYIYPIAFGIIAAQALYRSSKIKQIATMSILLMALLLLKGRAMILGTLAVAFLVSAPFAELALVRAGSLLAGIVISLTQFDFATGARGFISSTTWIAESFPSLLPYLTLGNGLDDLLLLDGRIPLWQTLWLSVEQHPLVGHGFGAFWNPTRFDDIYHEVGWHAVVAHNGFLDELLGTGVIGLLLFLAFWFCCIKLTRRVARHDRAAGYLVLGWLLLFLFFNSAGSLLQSYFQSPTLFSLTALFTVMVSPQQANNGMLWTAPLETIYNYD
jgi:O-antigen ligase